MNPWDLSASDLMIWGLVAHLVADWPLQNDWMAQNKANLRRPAGYVHATVHGVFLALVFGWVALPLAVAHLLIDTRKPVVWLSRLVGQTQPQGRRVIPAGHPFSFGAPIYDEKWPMLPLYDVGTEVRFWTDQVWHIACIAIAALAVTV